MITTEGIRYLLVKRYCEITGDTPGAVRARLHDGVWQLGGILRKDQLGRLHVDVEAFNRWVEEGQQAVKASSPCATVSASGSPSTARDTPSRSSSRRQKPTWQGLLG